MTILSAAVLLFLVMDPFGNIPVFLSVLDPVAPERRRRVIARELLIALGFLLAFLFGGQHLLDAIGIGEASLTVAGGIILFLIALRMVFPPPGGAWAVDMEEGGEEPFLVPLAVPFVAGPSVLASVLFIMSSDPGRWPEWLVSLLLAWSVSCIILVSAAKLSRRLGKRGLIAMERLMGMIVVAIGVEMIVRGVRTLVGELGPAVQGAGGAG
jgi:multiple antibiotic resistance protein